MILKISKLLITVSLKAHMGSFAEPSIQSVTLIGGLMEV